MHQMQYIIRTLSPILLTSISGDTNMVSTLDYIPGSVIRGIFAQKYIEKKDLKFEAHKDDFFYKSFLGSRLSFTNAYLSRSDDKNIINYYPTPFSIQSEKRDENTIYDLIKKENIDEQTKYVGKYCVLSGDSIDLLHALKSINFHNTRSNRIKGCSDDGSIYNYESLDPQQEFSGRIIGEKEVLEALFQSFGKCININIGRSKNIQYGKAKLTFFSDKPEEFASEVNAFKSDDIEKTFTMTLLSSAIIYNQLGFSTASLTDFESYLAEYLATSPEYIKIEKVFKKAEINENFISIWQMKRPSETAIKAGSCFKIEIKEINDKIKELLIELQKTGIGERTNEGFGRFILNLQVHGVLKKQQTKNEKEKQIAEKPAGKIPDLTKVIIKNAAIRFLINYTENRALEDCKGFCNNLEKLPTNSLIGKLEQMLNDSKNSQEFSAILDKLPELTQKKMRICRNKDIDLFEFIKTNEIPIEKNQHLSDCCKLIDFIPEVDKEFEEKKHKHYWHTFLRSMRKEKKKGGN